VGWQGGRRSIPLGTADFMVHHIQRLHDPRHRADLAEGVVLSAVTPGSSPIRRTWASASTCERPRPCGTCQVSAWGPRVPGSFLDVQLISIVDFHFSLKCRAMSGEPSNPGWHCLAHRQTATSLKSAINQSNGWLRISSGPRPSSGDQQLWLLPRVLMDLMFPSVLTSSGPSASCFLFSGRATGRS